VKTAFIVPAEADMRPHVEFAAQEGIDGIELMYWEPTTADLQVGDRKTILEDEGVALSAIGLWRVGLADPESTGHRDIILAGMDLAAELGGKVFFAGAGDPEGDDPAQALADVYPTWLEEAQQRGLELAVYLGHQGSYIFDEAALAEACRRIPDLGLKLDPVGLIRNLKAEPCHVLYTYGSQLTYFHVKGLMQLPSAELEPPPGLDELPWHKMFGILHQHGYDGYVSVEPHGRYWSRPNERRFKYVRLTFNNLAPYMLLDGDQD
jgi:sugar phosphate isomerase/epimerase